ncbi:hypothetical protein HMPREF1539_00039, partial [Fusobacterium nucleatum CTI-2]
NGLMECFFGLLKSEMFYEQEKNYKTLEECIDTRKLDKFNLTY